MFLLTSIGQLTLLNDIVCDVLQQNVSWIPLVSDLQTLVANQYEIFEEDIKLPQIWFDHLETKELNLEPWPFHNSLLSEQCSA